MGRLINRCEYCDKILVEVGREGWDDETDFVTYECGHTFPAEKIKAKGKYDIEFKDGRKLYPFQAETVKFLSEQANHRGGIFHDMGLGKTICAIGDLYLNPELLPAIIVCKSALRMQWFKEILNLTEMIPQILETSKDRPLKHLKIFIASYDCLRNAVWMDGENEEQFFKTVILDECQQMKNTDSKRTNAVRRLCRGKEYVMALSGTPIKNHAGEYFPILNLLRPEKFWSEAVYYKRDVDTYWDGYKQRLGGLQDPDRFHEKTKDFIIRFTEDDPNVQLDLPPVRRSFTYHELGDAVQQEYDKVYQQFMDEYEEGNPFRAGNNILAYMTRMRHLTGLAKINPVLDHIETFLNDTTGKIVVFTHHKDVHNITMMHLNKICENLNISAPVEIVSGMTDSERDNVMIQFCGKTLSQLASSSDQDPNPAAMATIDKSPRVMLASTLSAGEGLDGLQRVCSYAVMVERQWNPANEQQVEKRFSRIGAIGKTVNVVYTVALGTIDEFFAELVEHKRAAMKQVLDNEDYVASESTILRELAELLYAKGRKRWKATV